MTEANYDEIHAKGVADERKRLVGRFLRVSNALKDEYTKEDAEQAEAFGVTMRIIMQAIFSEESLG